MRKEKKNLLKLRFMFAYIFKIKKENKVLDQEVSPRNLCSKRMSKTKPQAKTMNIESLKQNILK